MQDRERVVLERLAIAERRDQLGVSFKSLTLQIAETRRRFTSYILVVIVKRASKPTFAPSAAFGRGNVGRCDLRYAEAFRRENVGGPPTKRVS